MSEFAEVLPRNPVDVLTGHIALRAAELEYLKELFVPAMEIVDDIQLVNEVLAVSDRPELVMTRRVPQLYLDSPNNLNRIDNFVPNMCGFGRKQFVIDDGPFAREGQRKLIGHLPYTDEERATIYLLSGHGEYHTFLAFAKEQGVDSDFAHEALMMTHTSNESFARMLILCPELTWHLINQCLRKPGEPHNKQISEELFVAYTIMSSLVDENDKAARRNGQDDDWALCH